MIQRTHYPGHHEPRQNGRFGDLTAIYKILVVIFTILLLSSITACPVTAYECNDSTHQRILDDISKFTDDEGHLMDPDILQNKINITRAILDDDNDKSSLSDEQKSQQKSNISEWHSAHMHAIDEMRDFRANYPFEYANLKYSDDISDISRQLALYQPTELSKPNFIPDPDSTIEKVRESGERLKKLEEKFKSSSIPSFKTAKAVMKEASNLKSLIQTMPDSEFLSLPAASDDEIIFKQTNRVQGIPVENRPKYATGEDGNIHPIKYDDKNQFWDVLDVSAMKFAVEKIKEQDDAWEINKILLIAGLVVMTVIVITAVVSLVASLFFGAIGAVAAIALAASAGAYLGSAVLITSDLIFRGAQHQDMVNGLKKEMIELVYKHELTVPNKKYELDFIKKYVEENFECDLRP